MSTKPPKRTPAKFYQQDIVQRIAPPHSYGIVLRCWHDAEDLPPNPLDPLMRPLEHGEVGVSFLADSGEREILPESALRLVDRTLNAGDYCKRNIDDVCSGVVTNLRVRGRVEHAITGEKVEGWWSTADLWHKTDADIGDHVIYDDWIGQIVEVFDESVVEMPNRQLVRVTELGSRLNVGERGSDILPPPTGSFQNIVGRLLGGGSQRTPTSGTVVAVRHSVYAIAWLALNQSLSPMVAEKKSRPQRFWAREDISKLTLIRGRSDLEIRVGDRVHFKDPTGKPSSAHTQGGEGSSTIIVQTFVVTETETMIDMLWQDGSRETLRSISVIPYINPDEYDCWPGDHVLWKSEEGRRAAIVQSVNATDRTALILLSDPRMLETVSVLELDPHGAYEQNTPAAQPMTDGFGVRRSDFVFIHAVGTTNSFEAPRVPRIGELESWVHETPVYDCHLSGWRKEMSDLGNKIAEQRNPQSSVDEFMKIPCPGDGCLQWIGEVTELNLDGSVEVMHPDLSIKYYPLESLTRLYDGIEQLEDQIWEDDTSDGHDSEPGELWAMNEDGTWRPEDGDDPDWEDADDSNDGDERMDVDSWNEETNDTSTRESKLTIPTPPVTRPAQSQSLSSDDIIPGEELPVTQADTANPLTSEEGPWKRFDICSSAPADHAFYSTAPGTPSKPFLARLNREYRVLASSLPDSIIVRAYEDRTDLLRSLIIGPGNTPYEDAPFVIDWMLDSNFPHSPPIAHFLSWTNGNGRVNPNLYEEGKVCLSILGTWAGDRNETWSASRSSLLQAFVSIQGLVLVKEPWFCEPAYEKLRGTEEGIVNSRLYNEKAYVLSRGFVRRALEIPLGGLESEIAWLYYTQGRLRKVLIEAQALIEKSKTTVETGADSDLAVPRLTTGGIIMLERTLNKLQGLLDSHRTSI